MNLRFLPLAVLVATLGVSHFAPARAAMEPTQTISTHMQPRSFDLGVFQERDGAIPMPTFCRLTW